MKLAFSRTWAAIALGLVLAGLSLPGGAVASSIVGSMAINGSPVNLVGGSDLSTATEVTFASGGVNNQMTIAFSAGDYSPIPSNTILSTSPLTFANLAGFTFSNATYGTFTSVASSGSFTSEVVSRSPSFADVFLVGTFVPAGGLPGKDPSETSLRISFNQSGAAVSSSASLNTPPVPVNPVVPEPPSLISCGIGVVLGLGYAWRRHRRATIAS